MRSTRRKLRGLSVLPKITESRSAISNAFHNNMEKRDSYQSKCRRRHSEPTTASFSSPVYIISVKDSEVIMLGSAHASTAFEMCICVCVFVLSKTQWNRAVLFRIRPTTLWRRKSISI
jgi:hypothetical protein